MCVVMAVVISASTAFAQRRLMCDSAADCGPDPGRTTPAVYDRAVAARTKIMNQRTAANPLVVVSRMPMVKTVLGSRSYDYSINLVSLAGRNNTSVNLSLTYNSRIWSRSADGLILNNDIDNPSLGFRGVDFGFLQWNIANSDWIVTAANGGKNELVNVSGTNLYQSQDSTYIQFNGSTNVVTYRDGTQVFYEQFGPGPFSSTSPLRPNKIESTNGNIISIAYTNSLNLSVSSITDTLGRAVNVAYDSSGRLATITQGSRTVTFGWNTAYVLNHSFSLPVIASPASGSVQSVLSSVTFADHTSVNFLYGDWGIVNRIERRSSSGALRAFVSYNFPSATAGALSDAPAFTQQTSFDGVNTSSWNYSVSQNSSGLVTSSAVTDPYGTTTATTFSSAGDWKDGLPLVEQVIDSSGKIWRTRTRTWTSDTGTSAVNPRVSSVVTQLDDGTQSAITYAYDVNGNVTDTRETDFAAGAPGPLLRETVTSYASLGNHILNRPAQVLVKDAAGILSRTDFAYDEYASFPLHGVSPAAGQHDDANYSTASTNARGNLTTKTVYANAPQGTGGIISTFTYDVLGNRIAAQEGCCARAHSVYSATTQYGFPDSVSTGPVGNQLTASFTYNLGSGTMASSTDANEQITTYTYDINNRKTSTHTPDGVTVGTSYDDASGNSGWTSSTTANSHLTTVTLDFGGHELSNKLFIGAALVSTISNSYDALGRITQSSNPFGPNDPPVYTIYTYDSLGRTTQRTPPALAVGSVQNSYQTNYSGHLATFRDPAGRQRNEIHNSLGELIEVDEPGASSEGTAASGILTITGTLRNQAGLGATRGTGTIILAGSNQCTPDGSVCDSGLIQAAVNGSGASVPYPNGDPVGVLAQSMTNGFSGNPYVTASWNNNLYAPVITLTARTTGSNTNYPLTALVHSNYPTDFNPPSYTVTASGPTLTGGSDGATVWDSGTVTVTIGASFTASAPYGQNSNSTAAQVFTALIGTGPTGLNRSGSPVIVAPNGTVTYKTVGTAGNVAVTVSSSTNNTTLCPDPNRQFGTVPCFPGGSFSGSTSLSGGQEPYPSGLAHPYVTQYNYDALGNLLQVNQGQQVRTFTYDSLNRPTSVKMPEKQNQAFTVTYTDFNAVATRTDARGVITNYGYDSLDRLTGIQYSDGTPAVTYSFGATGAPNFGAGRLISATDGAGSETYQYDAMGRETKCIRVIGANTYVITYAYTADGRIASTTYPSGRIVNNTYDGVGRLTQVGTGGTSLFNVNSYNAAGQMLAALYGNGIQASYSYNNQLQVASILIGNASPLLNLSYNWGGASDDGLLMGVTDGVSPARTTSYTYDQLKRLASAQTVDLTSPGTWRLQFAYDRYGNRLSQTPTGGTASMPSNSVAIDPTTNRITTAGYDADGNMTNDGVNTYTFDAENRITQVNGTANTYGYDGSGLRVTRNGNYYIYSGGRVIAEYAPAAPAASPTTEYVYARSKRVAAIASGIVTYPYWDHLSVRANANSSGVVIRTFGHYPFGETWYETGTHDKWGYTTYENDTESGLNYAMARFHNPRLGRFMSLDPWPADKSHPQSWNRYPHGNNNPISFSDPSGMDGCDDEEGGCGDGGGEGGTDSAALEDGPGDQKKGGGSSGGGDQAQCGEPNTACDSHGNCLMGDCMPGPPPDDNPNPPDDRVVDNNKNPDNTNSPDDINPGDNTDQSNNNGTGSSNCPICNNAPSDSGDEQHSDLHAAGDLMEAAGTVLFVGCQIAEPCGGAVDTIAGVLATVGFVANKLGEWGCCQAPATGNNPATNKDPIWWYGLAGH